MESPRGPFSRGAGRVDLTKAALSGLVLNETRTDYDAANPANGGDPTTLNIASLANAGCEATCSLATTASWSASVTKPKGMGLTVSPSSFTLAPGAGQTLTITADVSKHAVGQWLEGEVRLATGTSAPAVHLPVEVFVGHARSVELTSTGTSGSQSVSVTSKVAIKSFQARVSGLAKGVVEHLQMTQDATPLLPYDSPNTSVTIVDVPAGSRVLAAAITPRRRPMSTSTSAGTTTTGCRPRTKRSARARARRRSSPARWPIRRPGSTGSWSRTG